MLKDLSKNFVGEIQNFQDAMQGEKNYIQGHKLFSMINPNQQFQMQDQFMSVLNQFLMGSAKDRLDKQNCQNIVQIIKFLCQARADIKVINSGSYYCCYCFEKFTDQEIQIELFNKKFQGVQEHFQTIQTLQCGHTIHVTCFRDLIKDFYKIIEVKDNMNDTIECECPSCNQGEGKIQFIDHHDNELLFMQMQK